MGIVSNNHVAIESNLDQEGKGSLQNKETINHILLFDIAKKNLREVPIV